MSALISTSIDIIDQVDFDGLLLMLQVSARLR